MRAPQINSPVAVSAMAVTPVPTAGAAQEQFEPRRLRWDLDRFYALDRSGVLEGRRVLLLDGEVFEMAPQGNSHSVAIGKVSRALSAVFDVANFWVRVQFPINLTDGFSEPEPDLAVVRGAPDDYTAHPSTALLVVEVADSSLRLDRKKANAYAAAGVADYWIVDLAGHQVEVYREPVADAREPFEYRYSRVEVLGPDKKLSPVAMPGATVAVADLLPKQPVTDPDA